MITIGIVEDDEHIRTGIQKYLNLQKDLSCELAAESVEEAILNAMIAAPGMEGRGGRRESLADQLRALGYGRAR